MSMINKRKHKSLRISQPNSEKIWRKRCKERRRRSNQIR